MRAPDYVVETAFTSPGDSPLPEAVDHRLFLISEVSTTLCFSRLVVQCMITCCSCGPDLLDAECVRPLIWLEHVLLIYHQLSVPSTHQSLQLMNCDIMFNLYGLLYPYVSSNLCST
ncbi:hypothetical protein TNCV_3044981 [Trichonephila clavipes]|nr:hypothetical protein TNCV_3044981 [Trichonephila clavipes]